MGYIAIRHFDCYDQWFLAVDNVTIVESEVEDGSISGTFNYGESCTLVATPNADYHFVNWTENGNMVSTDASYSFTVTEDADLVANFAIGYEQTDTLSTGWTWWSTNLNITLEDLKTAIAGKVGSSGTATIKSQGGDIRFSNGRWSGNGITSLDIKQMYEIQTSVTCEIVLTGSRVNPTDYQLTINPGNNWIGFLPNESMTLDQAFGTFPVNGDVVKSRDYDATYYNGQWRGQLTRLQPGQGYIYESKATGNRTFTYGAN